MTNEEILDSKKTKPVLELDWTDTDVLKSYTTENGKILPRKYTYLNRQEQSHITNIIKRARYLLLLK